MHWVMSKNSGIWESKDITQRIAPFCWIERVPMIGGLRLPPKKREGLQLALEPLNGRGIAGYVPKP
jgi:hypothetical protein